MAARHLNRFPKPLLDDLVAGRWLPIVGAGFSRNAVLPPPKEMPLWPDLGKLLASELRDYELGYKRIRDVHNVQSIVAQG
jgi:hypothetical protein